jgi:acetyl-CoA carboxylase carboxyltransferase component
LESEELGLESLTGAGPAQTRKRTYHGIRVADLVKVGLVFPNERLVGYRKGRPYYASVLGDGRIKTVTGSVSAAPTAAMMNTLGVSGNGWAFWHVERTKERLDTIRQQYLERFGR